MFPCRAINNDVSKIPDNQLGGQTTSGSRAAKHNCPRVDRRATELSELLQVLLLFALPNGFVSRR